MTKNDEVKELMHALTNVDDRYVEDAMEYAQKRKKKKNPSFQWYAAFMAACAAALVIGITLFHSPAQLSQPGNDMTADNPYHEVSSLEEAEHIVGFEMEIPAVQKPYTKVQITVIDNNMIEVSYISDSNDTGYTVRKAEGNEDISGDYTEYDETVQETVNDVTITLKGDNDQYALAVWNADGYSYAVEAQDHPLTREQILAIVSAVK